MTALQGRAAAMEGALLGTFVGDALGARWEGAAPVTPKAAAERLAASLEAPTLHYTDDTQMTLALAEHLCRHPDVEPVALVQTFLAHFEDWRGYARGMHGLVAAWRRGLAPHEAATVVFPDGSFGNGAAMRVAPVGVLHAGDPQRVNDSATRQAVITHAHPIGVDAAVVQATAVAIATRSGVFGHAQLQETAGRAVTSAVRDTLSRAVQQAAVWTDGTTEPAAVAAAIGTDVFADQSVAAALWVAAVASDIPDAILLSLALGGDVDTIAAMACAVLGAATSAATIPVEWLDRLEDGPHGRAYATTLALQLGQAGV